MEYDSKSQIIDALTKSGLLELKDLLLTPNSVYVKGEVCANLLQTIKQPIANIELISQEQQDLAVAINNFVTSEVRKVLQQHAEPPHDEMMTFGLASDIKRDDRWPTFRKHHIKDECEACPSKEDLNLHHIEPFHENRAKELDPENVITLCRRCHLYLGHLDDWKSWNVNIKAMAKNMKQLILNRPYEKNVSHSVQEATNV